MALSNTPSFQSKINKELEVFRAGVSDLAKKDGVIDKEISTVDAAIESLKPSTLVKGPGADKAKKLLKDLKIQKAKLEGLKNEISKQTPSSVTKWVEKTIAKFHSDKELRELLPKSFLETLTQLRGVAKGNISIIKAREEDSKASLAQKTHAQAQKSIGASKRASHAVQTAATEASQRALGITPAKQAAQRLSAADQIFIESLESQVKTAFDTAGPHIERLQDKSVTKKDGQFQDVQYLSKNSEGIRKKIDTFITKAKNSKTPLKQHELTTAVNKLLRPVKEATDRLEAPIKAQALLRKIEQDWSQRFLNPKLIYSGNDAALSYKKADGALFDELAKGFKKLQERPLHKPADLESFNRQLNDHITRMESLANKFLSLDYMYRSALADWHQFPKKGHPKDLETLISNTMTHFESAIKKGATSKEIDEIVKQYEQQASKFLAPNIIGSALKNRIFDDPHSMHFNAPPIIDDIFGNFRVLLLAKGVQQNHFETLYTLQTRLKQDAILEVRQPPHNIREVEKRLTKLLEPMNQLLLDAYTEMTQLIHNVREDGTKFLASKPMLNHKLKEADKEAYELANNIFNSHINYMRLRLAELANPSETSHKKLTTIEEINDHKVIMGIIQSMVDVYMEGIKQIRSQDDEIQRTLKQALFGQLEACKMGHNFKYLSPDKAQEAAAKFSQQVNSMIQTSQARRNV